MRSVASGPEQQGGHGHVSGAGTLRLYGLSCAWAGDGRRQAGVPTLGSVRLEEGRRMFSVGEIQSPCFHFCYNVESLSADQRLPSCFMSQHVRFTRLSGTYGQVQDLRPAAFHQEAPPDTLQSPGPPPELTRHSEANSLTH